MFKVCLSKCTMYSYDVLIGGVTDNLAPIKPVPRPQGSHGHGQEYSQDHIIGACDLISEPRDLISAPRYLIQTIEI